MISLATQQGTEYAKAREVPENDESYTRILWLQRMFDRYEEYWDPEIERIVRNQRMMWGVNFGQWPAYVVEKLRSQGRRPPTLNIIGRKVELKVSSFMSNGFEVGYAPTKGETDSLSLALTDMRMSDKYNLRWKVPLRIALRDMFTCVGYESMVISDKFCDDGNISWVAKNPTHIYIDPGWKDYDPDRIRNYFEWAMLDVGQIRKLAGPSKSDVLDDLYEREMREGVNLGEYNGGVQRYKNVNDKWGDRHKVIAYHWVEEEKRVWEYDLKNRVMFPETGFPQNSPMDREAKIAYIKMMGLKPNEITYRPQTKREKRTEIIVPTLDTELFIARGKDAIQTNNCNIYPLGNGYNGQWKGDVDELYDIQLDYNKGHMNIQDIQLRAARGSYVLDRALTGGDASKEKEIESEWNNPAARIWVDEGATADLGQHGGIIKLGDGQVPSDMFRQPDRLLELSDWFSGAPAAMDARTENSGEPAKLYQTKYQVAMIGQKFGMEIWEAHENAKASAYAKQAKITYAGNPRRFTRGKNDSFEVNKRMEKFDETGNVVRYTLDDISKLSLQAVNIVPSRSGINLRNELQKQYGDALPLFNDPADRLARLCIQDALMETYELPDDRKEEIGRAFEILKQNAALEQAIANTQMKRQLAEMTGGVPQQPQAGQQVGALPAPGMGEEPQQQMTPGEPSEEESLAGTPEGPEIKDMAQIGV
jgi:hypothetical protein